MQLWNRPNSYKNGNLQKNMKKTWKKLAMKLIPIPNYVYEIFVTISAVLSMIVKEKNSLNFIYTLVTPHAKRAFFITFTGFTLCICSGTSMIVSYVTDIFTKTGSSISAKDASILVSVTQIVANFMFLNIVDRFNRRVCSKIPFETFSKHEILIDLF